MAARKHDFTLSNTCARCGATREQVDDNIMHAMCLVAERKDATEAGEYTTRIGTVYMRSKAHLTPTMRANIMEAVAIVLRGNAVTRDDFKFNVVDGTTLMIEMADAAEQLPAVQAAE